MILHYSKLLQILPKILLPYFRLKLSNYVVLGWSGIDNIVYLQFSQIKKYNLINVFG